MTAGSQSSVGTNAAENLVGVDLPGDWTVTAELVRTPGDTGGNFSINYWVENKDGRRGFCKVMNYEWLMAVGPSNHDPVQAIADAAATYAFERDMALRCIKMSKVITAIDYGDYSRAGYALPLVSFIIFESADADIRKLLNAANKLDIAVRLRCLHHLATGLRQLHTRQIAHQDVKPSNTLVFHPDASGARETKVGDLGRASARGQTMAHDKFLIAGDSTYAPPEGLYGAVPAEFLQRRVACDLYQLGSMICFAFTQVPLNALLTNELHPAHLWGNWSGTYNDVLPYLRDAFGRSLDIMSRSIPDEIRELVVRLVALLCEPDYRLRGDPKRSRTAGQYSLERVIAQLDLLTRRAEIKLKSFP